MQEEAGHFGWCWNVGLRVVVVVEDRWVGTGDVRVVGSEVDCRARVAKVEVNEGREVRNVLGGCFSISLTFFLAPEASLKMITLAWKVCVGCEAEEGS